MTKRLILGAVWVLATASCGPIHSLTVIMEATAEVEGARAADAQTHALYELTSAELYLEKALEEQAYADFEPAIVFGTKAAEYARAARKRSQQKTAVTAPPMLQESPEEPAGSTAPVRIVPVPPGSTSDGSSVPTAPPRVIPVPE